MEIYNAEGGYDGMGNSRKLNSESKAFSNSKPKSGESNKLVACNSPGYQEMSGKKPSNGFPAAGGNPGLPNKIST